MAIDTLNLRFGVISHGWLTITFCVSGEDIFVDASDVPADPIVPLVSLARFLLSSEVGSRDIEFYLEPESCVLTAAKAPVSLEADFRLIQPGCNVSGSGLPCLATATQIWRALRGIESDVELAIGNDQWSWDFPSTQMRMLSSEIETAKAIH